MVKIFLRQPLFTVRLIEGTLGRKKVLDIIIISGQNSGDGRYSEDRNCGLSKRERNKKEE
jgi:hypothetical protein